MTGRERIGLGWGGALFLLLFLPACMVVHGSIRGENPIDPDRVKAVVAGKTTRGEVLAAFGPPEALVRKGEGRGAVPNASPPTEARLPGIVPWGAGDAVTGAAGGGEREGYLALFADRKLTERHAVYYYSNSRMVFSSGFLLFAGEESRRLVRDRLWILVNDGTGLVEAVVWRPGDEPAPASPPVAEP